MKTEKECLTCRHHFRDSGEYPCSVCVQNDEWKPGTGSAGSITITTHTGPIPERDKQEKPQSLFKKYFLFWLKITKLIVQIYLKERYLSKYPDLNKFKRRNQKDFRDKIRLERKKLKELKKFMEMFVCQI